MARPKKYEDKNGKEFYGFESEADLKSYVTQQKSESSFETGTSSGGVEIGAGLQGCCKQKRDFFRFNGHINFN